MSRMEDLLAGDIQWQLHTTMTIDYAYEAALINKASNLENIAIYYDGNKLQDEINSFSHPVEPELLAKTKLRCFVVTPRSRQTFHAKISLVCFRENNVDKYRLMIYSKNHGFTADSCADIALLFDLIEDDSDSIFINNAKQLNSYINKIIVDTTPEGKNFIVDKGINNLFSNHQKGIRLYSKDYPNIKNIKLLFGGCGCGNLWRDITTQGSHNPRDPKLVLTPAFFVNQSFTDEELEVIKRSKVLYERIGKDDGFPKVSHIKLYLFDDIVYLGSANYTKPGVGYDFIKKTEHTPSVECLVGLPIDREKSNSLECSIKKYYDPFDGNIGFQHVEDECALYFMKNWKKESIKYYSNLENKTEAKRRGEARHVVVVLKSYNNVNMTIPDCHDLWIAPAEYDGNYYRISSEEQKGDTITLTYDFQKWQYHTGLFILKGFVKGQDNKEKEKRYVWDVGTDGVEEMFILKDSIPKEEFVSDLFLEFHNDEDICNFQSSEEKYEKNTKMKAFFDAITGI